MYNKANSRRATSRGFTLIELMVVVTIIAIIIAFGYPSYLNQVRKARLADGKATLMETAQQLERCYTRFSSYNDANCGVALPVTSPEGYYVVSAAAQTASSFTLDATPQGDQADYARCGVLRLNNTGQQGSQGAATDANDCW